MSKLISIIIPAHNESANIPLIYKKIKEVFLLIKGSYKYEIIFIDDGSTDNSIEVLEQLANHDKKVKYLEFSRNFGKEIATSAGIHYSRGDAAIMIDADLQHPAELIPEFIKKWKRGADIVIGVRVKNKGEGLLKKVCSWGFYKMMNLISDTKIIPQGTDFRLIDKKVINEFNRFTERTRITRGLLDWLGFKKDFIHFAADERKNGRATYTGIKQAKLALSAVISQSLFPLRFSGYLGLFISFFSGILGLFIFIEKYILDDPLNMHFSGLAILAVIILFLVGIILICLGLIALYIGNIQKEVSNRPMYIIRGKKNID
ncbi:glycosyltransferase family 2 protein [Patescibacteria group bacterium]|nr:glycosyltransferase family 2 protein [Patescibacteria group bacterium]MBU4367628.1 glycosyltransferase family 2 protein [Patescibacteria group bacterium]MBU4462108.1 glycosyltransferase family 2 protein [Patescibacteria group bacterium]MCG2700427.1 glycosyltransferase family 2 protein [Candidatus Parcubacteria bacterium]